MISSQDKNVNILKNEKSFQHEIKNVFIIFKGLSVARNCLRFESRPLNEIINSCLPLNSSKTNEHSKRNIISKHWDDSLVTIYNILSFWKLQFLVKTQGHSSVVLA